MPSERKRRLYACGCCRRIWDRLSPTCRQAVIAAEEYADGRAGVATLAVVREVCQQEEQRGALIPILTPGPGGSRYYQLTEQVHRVAAPAFTSTDVLIVVHDLRPWRGQSMENDAADAAHQRLFEDMFGRAERPVGSDPRWRTPAVSEAAWAIYFQRAFDRLPELADELAGAGCHDPDVLAHLRGGGEHVRGCWALDWVLGLG
ncbi:MAG TPA: hypothetical protein VKE74_17865 [Gemmataceae bacterium]|nr:hypothetical protein [Gemmataceae bacterium]